jgi:aspartyl/glutamyl-tRNA(Asn/Gln) amidotransferase C subunit
MSNADDASPKGLDQAAVRHVAKLARLRLTDEQVVRYQGQLESILGHISKLNAVDVGDVEPMAHPMPLNNRLAEDVPVQPMPVEALLRNAPAVEGRFLAVPKVLGEGSA